MKNTGPNDAAFPVSTGQQEGAEGMTMREWYAGMALQGLLACPNEDAWPAGCEPGSPADEIYAGWARMAFGYADAMLAEARKAADRE